jgi:hypothetical protein
MTIARSVVKPEGQTMVNNRCHQLSALDHKPAERTRFTGLKRGAPMGYARCYFYREFASVGSVCVRLPVLAVTGRQHSQPTLQGRHKTALGGLYTIRPTQTAKAMKALFYATAPASRNSHLYFVHHVGHGGREPAVQFAVRARVGACDPSVGK